MDIDLETCGLFTSLLIVVILVCLCTLQFSYCITHHNKEKEKKKKRKKKERKKKEKKKRKRTNKLGSLSRRLLDWLIDGAFSVQGKSEFQVGVIR